MTETLANSLIEFLGGIPDWLSLILISVLPILELRGGMIAAAIMDVPYLLALTVCVIGNMLPIPFILLFLNKVFAWMRRFPKLERILDFLDRKAEKNKEKVEKWKMFGLFVLVAIPLPGTGAWTGALVANSLNIPIKKSLPTIFLGVLGAAAIMSLTYIPKLF